MKIHENADLHPIVHGEKQFKFFEMYRRKSRTSVNEKVRKTVNFGVDPLESSGTHAPPSLSNHARLMK